MLKCQMIFSLPTECLRLYEGFKDGGSIREWINEVELLAKNASIPRDMGVNIALLRTRLGGDGWDIKIEDYQYRITKIDGKPSTEAVEMLSPLGVWDGNRWSIGITAMDRSLYRDEINKTKGDMLEILSEMFFQQFGADEAVGLVEYTPVAIGDDYGVDATGRNVNGHQCAVQVKFRSNPTSLISYADIARTFTSAVLQMNLADVRDHDHTVYLFTTANGVTGPFKRVMRRKCVVIGRGAIATKIDNNKTFWERAYKEIFATLDS